MSNKPKNLSANHGGHGEHGEKQGFQAFSSRHPVGD
jgi:hypothetical protein